MTTVKIGINPITWSNDDMPQLGGDTPLEVCLSETRLAGFAGTEMGGKFPKTSAEMRPLLAKHGLELVSGWFTGKALIHDVDQEFEAALSHLQLLKDMGCKYVVYADTSHGTQGEIDTPISKGPRLADDEWKAYGRKLTKVAEKMAEFGVGMAVHHHMATIIQTDSDIGHLMNHTGEAVGLLYDTGHCAYSGGDPLALVKKHVARIKHVHCKDNRRDKLIASMAADTSFLRAILAGVFTVPGDGSVDYPPILEVLARHGYSGWLVVEAEQDPKVAHPLTYAKMGYENLSRMAREAGFTVA
jgi:inosose dehydratase